MKCASESKVFPTNKTLNIHGRLIDLSKPKIMGVLNITPDSFYQGSRFMNEIDILRQAEKMLNDGATFIDVGGYSSRPGAEDISQEEERQRVVEAISAIIRTFPDAIISVDTFRGEVAKAAVEGGAGMVNDISGGELDHEMLNIIGSLRVPYILMHMRGNPKNMTKLAEYENLLKEISDYFHQKLFMLKQLGVKDVIVDPGFGFAKTITQNFELLNKLEYFKIFDRPILVGLSRKSMIWKTLNISPDEALNGTTTLNTIAIMKGASILRVHDVKEAAQLVQLVNRL